MISVTFNASPELGERVSIHLPNGQVVEVFAEENPDDPQGCGVIVYPRENAKPEEGSQIYPRQSIGHVHPRADLERGPFAPPTPEGKK